MLEDGMIGAIKIKDGLFIGDELAAKVFLYIIVLSYKSKIIKLY